jgi:hypothetical protein
MTADNMDFEKDSREEHGDDLIYETKYKGRPVLNMKKSLDDKYPFSFGLGKAKQVLENSEAIEAFVKKHSKESDE